MAKHSKSTSAIMEFLELARGNMVGLSTVNKFGRNPSVAINVAEDVWDGKGTYTFMASAALLKISSSDNGDTQDVVVIGLDSDWNIQEETVTLVGQTETEIGSGLTWIRVLRAYNDGTTDFAGDIYIYEDDTITAGVPDTESKIKAKITLPLITGLVHNQTLMAIYSVPVGFTAYIISVNGSVAKGKDAELILLVRKFGKVFRIMDHIGVFESKVEREYSEAHLEILEKSDIKITCASSAANTPVNAWFDLILVEN